VLLKTDPVSSDTLTHEPFAEGRFELTEIDLSPMALAQLAVDKDSDEEENSPPRNTWETRGHVQNRRILWNEAFMVFQGHFSIFIRL
jgi:hypothetical protein